MNERQSQLLKYIVEGYSETAQPIGSKFISQESGLQLSSATIRNEMAQLEEEGYITQPHTSAGRVPTIQGIEHYLEHLLELTPLRERDVERLQAIYSDGGVKALAKAAAEQSQVAAIIAIGTHDYYYTGFSYLFSRPEFSNHHLVHAISLAVDQLDSVLPQFIADKPGGTPKVYIGSRNPLGDSCVAMFVSNNKETLFGLLSPLRTDYAKNLSLLQTIASYL
jgi:transcriptional regulator of heat shock response